MILSFNILVWIESELAAWDIELWIIITSFCYNFFQSSIVNKFISKEASLNVIGIYECPNVTYVEIICEKAILNYKIDVYILIKVCFSSKRCCDERTFLSLIVAAVQSNHFCIFVILESTISECEVKKVVIKKIFWRRILNNLDHRRVREAEIVFWKIVYKITLVWKHCKRWHILEKIWRSCIIRKICVDYNHTLTTLNIELRNRVATLIMKNRSS
jgi:hypothetical protein